MWNIVLNEVKYNKCSYKLIILYNYPISIIGDVIRRLKWDFHEVRPLDIGYGYNERTKKSGVYPISKTKYYIKIADYPIFQNRNRSRAESIIQNLTKELI